MSSAEGQRSLKPRSLVERAALYLDDVVNEFPAVMIHLSLDRSRLGLNAKARPTLAVGADPQVSDELGHWLSVPRSVGILER